MDRENKTGLMYGGLSFIVWGILPLYWKLLSSVGSEIIFASRIFWAALFLTTMTCCIRKKKELVDIFRSKRSLMYCTLTGLFVSLNWFTYIWAVNAGQVLETSLGYYMNPLIVVLFGVVFLKEKLTRSQLMAMILASIGVVIVTINYGRLPIVALILSVAFSFYALFKKLGKLDALASNTAEAILLAGPASVYLMMKGAGPIPSDFSTLSLLIMSTGAVTALPLLWYSEGAKRLPLTTMGFLQYIAPTIQFALAIFVFKEPFDSITLIAFGFIWLALIVFSVQQVKSLKLENANA